MVEKRVVTRIAQRIDRSIKWVFPAPALMLFALILGFPILFVFYISFHEWGLSSIVKPVFVGFGNFLSAFNDDRFWHSMLVSLLFMVGGVGAQTILGILIAMLINTEFPGKALVRVALIMPMTATPVAISLIWLMMFEPTLGMLNFLLRTVGLSPLKWVNDIRLALPSLILVDTWQWTPFMVLIILAGLQTIPTEVEESARLDGAGPVRMLINIVLPLVRPHIVIAMILRMIPAIKTFDKIYVITAGGPMQATETLNMYVFRTGFEYYHLGYASALAILLLILVFSISTVLVKLRERSWEY